MNKKRISTLSLLTLGLWLASSLEARPPNVVFFLVDDLGWTDVGTFGSSFHETPHIDRFATEGVKFTSAYAACHVCSPTRSSILTGKYPARTGLSDWLRGRRDFPFQKLKNVPSVQQLDFA
jgi:arylsulfatase A-like enzyme